MDTLDLLTRKGYRIYKMKVKPTPIMKHYFKIKFGLHVEYHEDLKVILVRDAKSES
jgi:hypothetical protein